MSIKNVFFTRHRAFVAATLMVLLAAPAYAQLPAAQGRAATGQANPARVGKQLEKRDITPELSPSVEVKDLILQQVPEGAENIRFNLASINAEGVSAYSSGALRAVYGDKIGTNISLADVYAIATALTNKYRNDGYILTQVIVPPQTIEGGTVRLQVVEGYVDTITVQGEDQESALKLVRRYASKIKTNTALNVSDLERYLLLINDLPGVDARSILSPSRTKTGAADLRIIITRDPYDALLAVDNHGSRYLGQIQGSAAANLNSYFGNNETITAQVVVAPDADNTKELFYFSLAYKQPIPILGIGSTIEVSASHTSTEPGHDLDQFDVKGRSQLFSARLVHPFVRSRTRNATGRIVFDWRDVESKNILEFTRRDRIRAARAGATFEFLDQFFGVGINSIDLEVSQGLDLLGSSDEGDIRLTRPNANPTFTKMNAELQRLQRVSSAVNLLVAAQGQWSANALLSSEEFGVGGMNYGRGYDPSEIIGDDGFATKVEVQWNRPYPLNFVEDYQVYGFYDYGKVWNQDATTSSQVVNSLSSTGVGVRADFQNDIEAGLLLAFPLTRDVQTYGDSDKRLFMNLSRSF